MLRPKRPLIRSCYSVRRAPVESRINAFRAGEPAPGGNGAENEEIEFAIAVPATKYLV